MLMIEPEMPSVTRTQLSPISGSIDFESISEVDVTQSPPSRSPTGLAETSSNDFDGKSCPLTEENLKTFVFSQLSENLDRYGIGSPRDVYCSVEPYAAPTGDPDSCFGDSSVDVNWESEISDVEVTSSKDLDRKVEKQKKVKETWPQHRSFSDSNILESEKRRDKMLLLDLKHSSPEGTKSVQNERDAPLQPLPVDNCSDLSLTSPGPRYDLQYTYTRGPFTLLSFFTSPPKRPPATSRSFSHPTPNVTNPNVSDPESGNEGGTGGRRHRHSIAGQMSYFKMLGFGFGGPAGFKKLTAGSTSSLFSTAVISGSSSAPNLRDMIPSTASASGNEISVDLSNVLRRRSFGRRWCL